MIVELVDKMGTDLSVVNAARVSYSKNKETFEASDEKRPGVLYGPEGHYNLESKHQYL